jgi:hypothetical protein
VAKAAARDYDFGVVKGLTTWERQGRPNMPNPVDPPIEAARTPSEGWFAQTFRTLAFLVLAVLGISSVAAVVLLPEYVTLTKMENQRDAVAHQLACEQKLIEYNNRVIQAIGHDPILTERLLIRYGNYRPAGAKELDVNVAARPSVAAKLNAEALQLPPVKQDQFTAAARWVDDPFTSLALLALGLGMLATSIFLTGPRQQVASSPISLDGRG